MFVLALDPGIKLSRYYQVADIPHRVVGSSLEAEPNTFPEASRLVLARVCIYQYLSILSFFRIYIL